MSVGGTISATMLDPLPWWGTAIQLGGLAVPLGVLLWAYGIWQSRNWTQRIGASVAGTGAIAVGTWDFLCLVMLPTPGYMGEAVSPSILSITAVAIQTWRIALGRHPLIS